jgi:hypothetical protein
MHGYHGQHMGPRSRAQRTGLMLAWLVLLALLAVAAPAVVIAAYRLRAAAANRRSPSRYHTDRQPAAAELVYVSFDRGSTMPHRLTTCRSALPGWPAWAHYPSRPPGFGALPRASGREVGTDARRQIPH